MNVYDLNTKQLHKAKVLGLIPISAYGAKILMHDNPNDGLPQIAASYGQNEPDGEPITISIREAFKAMGYLQITRKQFYQGGADSSHRLIRVQKKRGKGWDYFAR